MPRRPDELYLVDMLEATAEISTFIKDVTAESFAGDSKTRRAVLQCLIQMGEASARLSQDIRERHASVDWRGVIDMRNFAVHEYFSVDWGIIWITARNDVPPLAELISDILDGLQDEPSKD